MHARFNVSGVLGAEASVLASKFLGRGLSQKLRLREAAAKRNKHAHAYASRVLRGPSWDPSPGGTTKYQGAGPRWLTAVSWCSSWAVPVTSCRELPKLSPALQCSLQHWAAQLETYVNSACSNDARAWKATVEDQNLHHCTAYEHIVPKTLRTWGAFQAWQLGNRIEVRPFRPPSGRVEGSGKPASASGWQQLHEVLSIPPTRYNREQRWHCATMSSISCT